MEIYVIIYLVGFVVAYAIERHENRVWLKKNNFTYTWYNVGYNVLFSCLSWLRVFYKLYVKAFGYEPPKFL